MAEEHVRALAAAGVPPERILVVGRGRERAEALAARHGVGAAWGGAEALPSVGAPLGIVAVPETGAVPVALALLDKGVGTLLVEKPGALTASSLRALDGLPVFVGYNRRFLPSVDAARAAIAEDGGVLACTFEFTEIESRVLEDAGRRGLHADVLARWGIANSLHVLDLAFHLAGAPATLAAERAGSLSWHPAGATFAGSGRTERGALFAYSAAWGGAGRWGVEVVTSRRRLVLRPLEALSQQARGSFELEDVELPAEPAGVKPGLAGQLAAVRAAAAGGTPDARLCTVGEAVERIETAAEILGYD